MRCTAKEQKSKDLAEAFHLFYISFLLEKCISIWVCRYGYKECSSCYGPILIFKKALEAANSCLPPTSFNVTFGYCTYTHTHTHTHILHTAIIETCQYFSTAFLSFEHITVRPFFQRFFLFLSFCFKSSCLLYCLLRIYFFS